MIANILSTHTTIAVNNPTRSICINASTNSMNELHVMLQIVFSFHNRTSWFIEHFDYAEVLPVVCVFGFFSHTQCSANCMHYIANELRKNWASYRTYKYVLREINELCRSERVNRCYVQQSIPKFEEFYKWGVICNTHIGHVHCGFVEM